MRSRGDLNTACDDVGWEGSGVGVNGSGVERRGAFVEEIIVAFVLGACGSGGVEEGDE
jgi:hypothetical protein